MQFDPVEWGKLVQRTEALENENRERKEEIIELAKVVAKQSGRIADLRIQTANHNLKLVVITAGLMVALTTVLPFALKLIEKKIFGL